MSQDGPTQPQATTERIKAGTLQNVHDAWVWDVAEQQRILRAATATGFGLDPQTYARPFPGTPPQQTFVAVEQNRNRLGGLATAALVAATGLGGVGLGGIAASQVLNAVARNPAPAATSVEPAEYEVIFESNGKRIDVEKK